MISASMSSSISRWRIESSCAALREGAAAAAAADATFWCSLLLALLVSTSFAGGARASGEAAEDTETAATPNNWLPDPLARRCAT